MHVRRGVNGLVPSEHECMREITAPDLQQSVDLAENVDQRT
jgi:hypothetical protein